MLEYINNLLGEASTYRGIATFLTGVGVAVSPEHVAAITAAGLAVHGVLGLILPDKLGSKQG